MHKWRWKAFLYTSMPTNKCRRNAGIRKMLFGNHYSNDCFRQESSMDAKTSR